MKSNLWSTFSIALSYSIANLALLGIAQAGVVASFDFVDGRWGPQAASKDLFVDIIAGD